MNKKIRKIIGNNMWEFKSIDVVEKISSIVWKESQKEYTTSIIDFLESRWNEQSNLDNNKEKSLILSLQKFMLDYEKCSHSVNYTNGEEEK